MRAAISGALAALMVTSTVTAQPSQSPDLAHAKVLYDTANQAMSEGRYLDAAQAYGAAYDITHDPILFFKIGAANEKAGRCDVALIYFGRYLREGKPDLKFQAMAQDHVRACGGDARNLIPADEGSAAAGSDQGSAAPAPLPTAGEGSGSAIAAAPAPLPPPVPVERAHGSDAAWLMVGGGLAFVTVGAVLAYSASSSEQDLRDLYVGLDGKPPTYDATVAKRYQSLVDEGNRYEHMSWGSFAIAGAFAITATVLFLHHHDHVEPSAGGVAVRF